MEQASALEVRRDDLARTRLVETPLPALREGEIRLRIDRFALTANNVTYGVVGERLGYWQFFPARDGWGVIPVWGFADVTESHHPDVPVGERLYGFWPMGTHLIVSPASVKADRLTDGVAHRAALPPVYNSYARVRSEPDYDPAMEDERSLLFPLYATSFCLYDYLLDNDWFGAEQMVIVSASSKTAIGLALALADDDSSPRVFALTSRRNLAWLRHLGLHGAVHAYEDLGEIDASVPTVIADLSGHGAVLSSLHVHLADNMRYCANVGITHYDETAMGPGYIAERSAMFFAPSHIQKRTREWGPGVFQQKAFRFWRQAALLSRSWLRMQRYTGLVGLEKAYRCVLSGEVAPDRGVIVEL